MYIEEVCFEESKFTYLSNIILIFAFSSPVLKNQNLHISQTGCNSSSLCSGFEESKFTYLSNNPTEHLLTYIVLKNQNLHISQTKEQ